MKKILILLLGLGMFVFSVGCSNSGEKDSDKSSESSKEIAMNYVENFVNGNYDKAMENFNEKMTKEVNKDALKQMWDSIIAQYGEFKEYSYDKSQDVEGATQNLIKADFEKGSLCFIVPVDKDNKIVGFFMNEYK